MVAKQPRYCVQMHGMCPPRRQRWYDDAMKTQLGLLLVIVYLLGCDTGGLLIVHDAGCDAADDEEAGAGGAEPGCGPGTGGPQ